MTPKEWSKTAYFDRDNPSSYFTDAFAKQYAEYYAQALREENERLKSGWISVGDRLPDTFKDDDGDVHYEWVLTTDGHACRLSACQYQEDGTWYMMGDYLISTVKVTHWMPLPEPPKKHMI